MKSGLRWIAAAALALTGCSLGTTSDDDAPAEKQQALTASQARVFGFEDPTTDWSTNNGATVTASSNAVQGTTSLAVVPVGWTEINSIPLSTLDNVRDTLEYRIRVPAMPTWGETRVVLVAPSLNLGWEELGRYDLTTLPAGEFVTVSYPLGALQAVLSGSYSDLTIKVVINAEPNTSPYLIDGLVMTNDPDPDPEPEPDPDLPGIEISVAVPQGLDRESTMFSATQHLSVFSQTVVGEPPLTPALANFGPFTTYFQAAAKGYTDVYSVGPVQLDVHTVIGGDIYYEGALNKQSPETDAAPVVVGDEVPTDVEPEFFSWTIQWPTTNDGDVDLMSVPEEDRPLDTTLAPGAYGNLNVHSGNRVFLSTGVYHFSSFNTEPESELHVDTDNGPIFIYVEGSPPYSQGLGYKGGLVADDDDAARILLTYLGTGDVFLQAPFKGTVVAPSARIKLERPTLGAEHVGAFFGMSIEAASGQYTVRHVPLEEWPTSFTCPLPDVDGDGADGCEDACPNNADKIQPGACGCYLPDDDDDGDGIVNCLDGCQNDPTNAACEDDDELPEIEDGPGDTEDGVDQNNCNDPDLLTDPDPFVDPQNPTPEELAAARAGVNEVYNNAFGLVAGACEDVQAPEDCPLDPTTILGGPEATCTGNADCAPGYVCDYAFPTTCAGTPDAIECQVKRLRCGLRDADCLNPEPPITPGTPDCGSPEECGCATEPCECVQFDLCSDPGYTGSSEPADMNAYDPRPPGESPVIGIQQPPPDPVYVDPPNQPGCPTRSSGDCWCKLGVGDAPKVDQAETTTGDHGGGSLVNLTFKPDVNFVADASPAAFGEANFDVSASASLYSNLSVALPLVGSESVDLIDFAAGVAARRCHLRTTDTRFKVLGVDFVDLTDPDLADPINTSSADSPLKGAADACSTAFVDFIDAADQLKRAQKDAQQLLQMYRDLPSDTTFDKASFCDAVSNSPDEDFPNGNCMAESVEETINRYVDYYNDNRIPNVASMMSANQAATATFAQALADYNPEGSITFLDVKRHESVTIINAQFFVGPIPVNVTVDVGMGYGIEGKLFYRFTPTNALALADGTPTQLVGVGGKLIPGASAELELFAGVGFDVPGFAVKAGISGNLVLIRMAANLEAGVGLSMVSTADERPTPPPLDELGVGPSQLPIKQYEFFLDWFYGARLGVPEILSGTINGKVKLKAFFFSKTFKKTIFQFGPAFSVSERDLFSGGGQLSPGIGLPAFGDPGNSLGIFEMQTPMPRLRRLTPDPSRTVEEEFDEGELVSPLHFSGVCDVIIVVPA